LPNSGTNFLFQSRCNLQNSSNYNKTLSKFEPRVLPKEYFHRNHQCVVQEECGRNRCVAGRIRLLVCRGARERANQPRVDRRAQLHKFTTTTIISDKTVVCACDTASIHSERCSAVFTVLASCDFTSVFFEFALCTSGACSVHITPQLTKEYPKQAIVKPLEVLDDWWDGWLLVSWVLVTIRILTIWKYAWSEQSWTENMQDKKYSIAATDRRQKTDGRKW
jgi:hypothetical protein